jgi:Holliday junction resolvase RusA-like endonuclease
MGLVSRIPELGLAIPRHREYGGIVGSWLTVHSNVNPGDLGVNLRFKGKQVIHPRARAAQNALIEDVKQAVEKIPEFNPEYGIAGVLFVFTSKRFDIDGPLKRTLDALERGIKAAGYNWNDSRIKEVYITKEVGETPMLSISLR